MTSAADTAVPDRTAAAPNASSSTAFDVGLNGKLPLGQLIVLGFQNIFGMIGMFVFPGILGQAMHLPLEQIAEGHVFVAEQDGMIVGFAAVVPRQDGQAELDALFVDPTLWKRGVGRLLVDHCARVAHERSARLLNVVGNPHAEGFYLACGFRTVGIVETRFGRGLAMQREV